jgi:hypothetical protein
VWATNLATLASLAGAAALAPTVGGSATRGLTFALFVGSSVHVAATGALFTFPEVRRYATSHRYRYLMAPASLVVIAAAVAATTPTIDINRVLLAYFAWQFFHYQKQNLGITALAARSQGCRGLSRGDRTLILGSGWLGILGLVLRPRVLQLAGVAWNLDAGFRLDATALAGLGLIAAVSLGRRDRSDRPAAFVVAYLLAVYFPLPIFIFASPYAAVGGMTIAHGLQYLILVGLVTTGPALTPRRWPRLATVAAFVVTAGVLLNLTSHLHSGGSVSRAVYGAYLGAVMSHFVVDAGLWRLRDPFPRAFLTARIPTAMTPHDVSASGVWLHHGDGEPRQLRQVRRAGHADPLEPRRGSEARLRAHQGHRSVRERPARTRHPV